MPLANFQGLRYLKIHEIHKILVSESFKLYSTYMPTHMYILKFQPMLIAIMSVNSIISVYLCIL